VSIPQKPPPAKLVASLFMCEKALFQETVGRLAERGGSVDMVSPWLPFDQTDYYHAEMGFPLFRRLVAFDKLIEQEALAETKIFTNEIEAHFFDKGKRTVNIDPGYMVAERFVLATGKNFTHRIYLKKGIFADLTLIYQRGRFRPLEWTYPDYAGTVIIGFLRTVRDRYLYQLKNFFHFEIGATT
jgi:hypothetical protein